VPAAVLVGVATGEVTAAAVVGAVVEIGALALVSGAGGDVRAGDPLLVQPAETSRTTAATPRHLAPRASVSAVVGILTLLGVPAGAASACAHSSGRCGIPHP